MKLKINRASKKTGEIMKLNEVCKLKLKDSIYTRLNIKDNSLDKSHFLCRVIDTKTLRGICNQETYILPLQTIPQDLLGQLVLVSIRDLLNRENTQVRLVWYDPEA